MIDKTIGVLIAIIGLASLAVVLSKKSNTASVFGVVGKSIVDLVKAATAPVTG